MRKPFTLLLAFLLLVLSVTATALGLADIYRSEAATLVEAWGWSEEEGPPAWAWEQVERYLWLASRLAPLDAQIKSDLGQLYENRVVTAQVEGDPGQQNDQRSGAATAPEAALTMVMAPKATAPEPKVPVATTLAAMSPVATAREATAADVSTDLDTALGFYRQALALRPAWPQAWADVAQLKITQEHIDAEFAFAAQRALILGPRESRIQAGIAGGSLSVWDQLPAELQADIEHTIQRGLSNGSRFMQLVARRFDLLRTGEVKPVQAVSGNSSPEG